MPPEKPQSGGYEASSRTDTACLSRACDRASNVLLIIVDQLRADCLFGTLSEFACLPNLRAIMRDAVSFRRHYSVCAPCGPARASILTGQYAMNHRAVRNGTPLPYDKPNLATEVRKAGYLPLLFGYTDSAQDPRRLAPGDPRLKSYEEVMTGFHEVLRMRLEDDVGPWRAALGKKGYHPTGYPDVYRPCGPRIDSPAIYSSEDSDTAFLAAALMEDLSQRPPGWFAHATFVRPHPPFVAPEPYNRLHDPGDLPAPIGVGTQAEERARHPFLGPQHDTYHVASNVVGFPTLENNPQTVATLRAIYLGLASEVDHHIGRIVRFLRKAGLYDSTLLVVTSDHGEMLGDHHSWGKMTYYDAAYHTPLIIRDPRRPHEFGTFRDCFTESIDVAPTVLDWLGLEIPHSMDGRSLLELLDGMRPECWRSGSYSELDFGNPVKPTRWQRMLGLDVDEANLAVLRTRTHTLVHFAADLPQILFDRTAHGELRDVSASPDDAQTLHLMTREMLNHRMRNPEGLFSGTVVTRDGVRVGST